MAWLEQNRQRLLTWWAVSALVGSAPLVGRSDFGALPVLAVVVIAGIVSFAIVSLHTLRQSGLFVRGALAGLVGGTVVGVVLVSQIPGELAWLGSLSAMVLLAAVTLGSAAGAALGSRRRDDPAT